MNILIIEDEKITADALESILHDIAPYCTIAGKVGSIKDSVQWLLTHSADLIFMDIQLSDGLCFSITEQVPITIPVIFTTAYNEYALNAFRLNSVDYVLKPYDESSIRAALLKYQTMKNQFSINHQKLMTDMMAPQNVHKKRFLVQAGIKFVSIDVEQVAYFYSLEKSTYLCSLTGKTYDLEMTLDKLETELDTALFFRINRKFILNIQSIVKMIPYSRSRLKMELNPPLPDNLEAIVSIDRSVAFKQWLNL